MSNEYNDQEDGIDMIPELPDDIVRGTSSDCCNAPTKTIEGMLVCTQCGELCSPW